VFDEGWGSVVSELIIAKMKWGGCDGGWDMATYDEAAIYLYKAFLRVPPNHTWTRIHRYPCCKLLRRRNKDWFYYLRTVSS